MNILILGPQASGKGTQAKLLADKFGLFYFESGRFLRDLAKKDPKIRKRINKGYLIPDEEMFSLVSLYLEEKTRKADDIILDGYPRSIKQYQLLKNWLEKRKAKVDYAIFLDIDEEESIRRLSARRMDRNTGKIYNLITDPPGPEVKKENLIQREDDKPSVIKERLSEYKEETLPLVRLLDKEGVLVKVDGERPIETIFKDILLRLQKKDEEK